MSLTDSDVLKFQRGTPYVFEDICLIYPRKMGEIIDEGYDVFQEYLSIMVMKKPDALHTRDAELRNLLKTVTDFQYLLLLATLDYEFNQKVVNAFRFFCNETSVVFSLDPAQIVLGPLEEKHLLTEDKFYRFQDVIRKMYFLESVNAGNDIEINDQDNAKVREIKEKIRKHREQVKKAKEKKGQSDLKLSDLIGSVTLNNCGLNIENIWNITYYAFHDQLKRMGWRDQFNINHSAALAGAKIKNDQLKYWIRSINDSDKN